MLFPAGSWHMHARAADFTHCSRQPWAAVCPLQPAQRSPALEVNGAQHKQSNNCKVMMPSMQPVMLRTSSKGGMQQELSSARGMPN
jgi:hypothetical protein